VAFLSIATKLVNDYKAKGIDVRLGYVEFDGSGTYSYDNSTGTYSSKPEFTSTLSDFTDIINNHIGTASAGSPKGLEALQGIESMNFRENALKQVVLISNSSVDTTALSVNDITSQLQEDGITASVIGDASVKTQLEPMAVATGSSFYDNTTSAANIESGLYTLMKDDIYNNVETTQNIISDVRNRLNLLVNVMAREVNSLHRSGLTLDGNAGSDFFVAANSAYPIEIGNLKLNDNLDNLNNVVSSSTGKNGDNTIALDIANMRNTRLIGKTGTEVSLDDFYRSIISYVGNTGSDALNIADSQSKLVASADATRQSIAGVSMDEEMTNMMKYKFAYDAASRVINVIDAMLETVVTRTGMAGR
jgi:flagellar hook-associated protein 1 FlgK